MSPQDELTLLESAYQQMLQGKIQSYQIDKRSVKYFDLKTLLTRIDQVRAEVQRAATGAFTAGQFRMSDM
ncbi:MAG: hypothetical protein M0Z50_15720 [Planctomycetia bacterium]|nr:hypothetical protein [Planctomycetia bacterium]